MSQALKSVLGDRLAEIRRVGGERGGGGKGEREEESRGEGSDPFRPREAGEGDHAKHGGGGL